MFAQLKLKIIQLFAGGILIQKKQITTVQNIQSLKKIHLVKYQVVRGIPVQFILIVEKYFVGVMKLVLLKYLKMFQKVEILFPLIVAYI